MATLSQQIEDWFAQQDAKGGVAVDCVTDIEHEIRNVCERVSTETFRLPLNDDQRLAPYLARVWRCAEHHWSALSPAERPSMIKVIERVEAGILSYGVVEENLFIDVLLAEGLAQQHSPAANYFATTFMPIVRETANRLGGSEAETRFENLAADLILPRENRPCRIATYVGKTPLKSWLRVVVANLWVSHLRRQKERTNREFETSEASNQQCSLETAQCEELLKPAFLSAVGAVELEDRVLLKWSILDGVPQNVLAKQLGINPGTVTRRRQRAAHAMFTQIRQFAVASSDRRCVDDCLELLLAGESAQMRNRLGELLATELDGSAHISTEASHE